MSLLSLFINLMYPCWKVLQNKILLTSKYLNQNFKSKIWLDELSLESLYDLIVLNTGVFYHIAFAMYSISSLLREFLAFHYMLCLTSSLKHFKITVTHRLSQLFVSFCLQKTQNFLFLSLTYLNVLFPLTQFNILVICEDEDDVGADVAPVSLEPWFQSLIGQEDGGVSHRQHGQQHQEPGRQPLRRHLRAPAHTTLTSPCGTWRENKTQTMRFCSVSNLKWGWEVQFQHILTWKLFQVKKRS